MAKDKDKNKNPLILKFKKPYMFESKEYESVDLTAMDDWTCEDVVALAKSYNLMVDGDVSAIGAIIPESDLEYDLFVAAEASKLPLEFFHRLPAREVGAMRSVILGFFHAKD